MIKLRFPSIARVCTERKLKKVFSRLKPGKVLYIGVLTNLYNKLIPHTEFITCDIDPALKPNIVCDVHDIKIENDVFDTTVAIQVLEHCRDPAKAIKEMHRVLKKGGIMIISVPFLYPYHASPKDYYRFTEDSLKELTKDFESVQTISIGNKFLTLCQILGKGNIIKTFHIQKLFHLFNPILKYMDFVKKTDFALGYIVVAKK